MAALYRYRVMHILQLERLRTRIASDLHDDLGASLTQIAVVSDQLRVDHHRNGNVPETLAQIAEIAREMSAALGDVVWYIGPERDHLADLLSRMRRIGNDLCEAHGIEFSFAHVAAGSIASLDGQIRRNIFLIFKEALRNAIRHSKCRQFEATCDLGKESLVFTFADDGVGFNQADVSVGQGLVSMTRRAKTMNSSLRIKSLEGKGTRIELSVPLKTKMIGGFTRA